MNVLEGGAAALGILLLAVLAMLAAAFAVAVFESIRDDLKGPRR